MIRTDERVIAAYLGDQGQGPEGARPEQEKGL